MKMRMFTKRFFSKSLILKGFFYLLLFPSAINAAQTEIIQIKEQDLFPEGITSDSVGNLYLSSLKKGKIVKIDYATKQESDLVKSGQDGNVSTVGILADNKNNALYVCSSDPGISEHTGKAKVALKIFNLTNGELKNSYDFPAGQNNSSFCNDIALDNKGNVYVTDSYNPRILILPRKGKELKEFISSDLFKGEGFSLNGIDFQDGHLFVNKYNDGRLFRINIKKKKIEEVSLSRPLSFADGMKFVGKDILFVVEGQIKKSSSIAVGGTGALSKIVISESKDGLKGDVKEVFEGLDTPTTFVANQNGIFVVESQYDHIFINKNTPVDTFKIFGIKLQ